MSLVYTPSLPETLKDSNVLVDTCAIIEASKNEDLEKFFDTLKKDGCTFLTLPSVKDEFTCGAKDLEEFRGLSDFFDSQQIILMPKNEEKLLTKEGIYFNIALARSKVHNPSYVDRSLLFLPYIYQKTPEKVYIATSNHKDIPREFYDLIGFISYEKNGFRNIGIYSFNLENFNKIISNIH